MLDVSHFLVSASFKCQLSTFLSPVLLFRGFPLLEDVLVPTFRAIPIFCTLIHRLVNFDIFDLAFCALAFRVQDTLFQGMVRPSVDTDHVEFYLLPISRQLANIEHAMYTISLVFRAPSDICLLDGHQ